MTFYDAENLIIKASQAGKICNLLVVMEDPETPEKLDYKVVFNLSINREIICSGYGKAFKIISGVIK